MLGKPEYGGRVRGIGTGIGLKQFFGRQPRKSSKAKSIEGQITRFKESFAEQMRREYDEKLQQSVAQMTQQITQQLIQQFQMVAPPTKHEPPPPQHVPHPQTVTIVSHTEEMVVIVPPPVEMVTSSTPTVVPERMLPTLPP